MAQETEDGQERSEEPTDERREDFRQKGDIAHSRELTNVFVFLASFCFLSFYSIDGFLTIRNTLKDNFILLASLRIDNDNIASYTMSMWTAMLYLILPVFVVTSVIAIFSTLLQTKFNFSWEKINFSFNKINPVAGISKIFSFQTVFELFKNIGKISIISLVTYLLLYSERRKLPALINLPIFDSTFYFNNVLFSMFLSVAILMLILSVADYIYNFIHIENMMKMSKQEVKEEFRKREIDPLVKQRMRKFQRDIVSQKTIKAVQKATVLITNPTHFAIAIDYRLGMKAPIVLAKGIDFAALRMREIAKEAEVPIVENKPLAQSLYHNVNINEEVPERLYKAIAEVIRYVFNLKGVKIKAKNGENRVTN